MIRPIFLSIFSLFLVSVIFAQPSFAESAVDQYHRERAEAQAKEQAMYEQRQNCQFFSGCAKDEHSRADQPAKPFELENSSATYGHGSRKSISGVILQQLEPVNGR